MLSTLSRLKKGDEGYLGKMLKLIKTGTPKEMERDLPVIARLPTQLIYALAEKSPEIQHFFATDSYLDAQWKTVLKNEKWDANKKWNAEKIVSFDGQLVLTSFDQMKGAFLLTELSTKYKNKLDSMYAIEILNKACEIGMYDALVMRMEFYLAKIRKEKDIEVIESYIDYVIQDAKKVSNLYWAMGCVEAGAALIDITHYYFHSKRAKVAIERFFQLDQTNFTWQKYYDNAGRPLPILRLEEGVEYLYLAKLIASLPQSQVLTHSHKNSKNILALKDIEDPIQFEAYIRSTLRGLDVHIDDNFLGIAQEHARIIVLEYHPEAKIELNAVLANAPDKTI